MADSELATRDGGEFDIRLPWFVKVSPDYYDDPCDTGYGWEGWAVDADDAVAQALAECHLDNDREPDLHDADVDPARAKIHVVEVDFRRFAGPLVHWARTMGGWDSPVWDAMEAAVAKAGLAVAPFADVEGR
jgi:hypothetical protein